MGAHRDDREAARARIAALERELVDAKDDAERARRDADEARRAAERRPAGTDPATAHTVPDDPRWRPGARVRYVRGTRALAAAVYTVSGGLSIASAPIGAEQLATVLLGGSIALVGGIYAVGRIVGAPAPYEGSTVTLIASPIFVGLLCATCHDGWWPWFVPEGPARLASRIACSVVVVAVGALATAAWATDAASAPDRSDD